MSWSWDGGMNGRVLVAYERHSGRYMKKLAGHNCDLHAVKDVLNRQFLRCFGYLERS